ncbi:TPA: DNA cytosine methyltransferase [Corynebacterium striatum]|nr:DNA cytosine methyltransferase [Corynebacterium striatum]
MHTPLTSIEICAGAGGQALGLERAGFNHLVAVEIDDWAVKTLQANRPEWNVIQADVLDFDVSPYAGADRLPKSIARVHTPRLHGVQALAELKALRSHALSQSLPYGVLFMCLGQVMAWGSSMLFPLVAWFLAGISFGLAVPIIYREKDDVPIAFIRAQVGFREAVSYLHLGIPLVFTAVAAAGISKQPAFGVAALFTALAAYFLGGRVDIVPAGAHTLRYRSAAPTPTILLEMLVLLVLLGVWWLFFFALSLLP